MGAVVAVVVVWFLFFGVMNETSDKCRQDQIESGQCPYPEANQPESDRE